ncbi:MAG: type II secretion system F family protein [Armatimonadota bacterium]|nr:MAG: type II secretion system F family protein [Armatimonadota bacterium]
MSNDQNLDPLDLVVYTRAFAVLLSAGVPLVRILDILADVADEPLRSATVEMRKGICESNRTLSAEMRERPMLFTTMYAALVRAGEVGGVLDESLERAADALEADWADAQVTGTPFRSLLHPSREEAGFSDSAPDEQLHILAEYFGSLALMLISGVPIVQALETAAEVFPPGPEQEVLIAAPERIKHGESLGDLLRLPFLPTYVSTLFKIGEQTHTVDTMCQKVAQLLEHQRRYHLLKQAQ